MSIETSSACIIPLVFAPEYVPVASCLQEQLAPLATIACHTLHLQLPESQVIAKYGAASRASSARGGKKLAPKKSGKADAVAGTATPPDLLCHVTALQATGGVTSALYLPHPVPPAVVERLRAQDAAVGSSTSAKTGSKSPKSKKSTASADTQDTLSVAGSLALWRQLLGMQDDGSLGSEGLLHQALVAAGVAEPPIATPDGPSPGMFLCTNPDDGVEAMWPVVEKARRRAKARSVLAAPPPSRHQKDHWQALSDVMEFVFPPTVQKPHSTGRLFVLAEFGPLGEDGQLHGGKAGSRVITQQEIQGMIREIEHDDVLAVYLPKGVNSMSALERKAVLTDVMNAKLALPRMAASQVVQLIMDVDNDGDGKVSFHALADAIRAARAQRIADMKVMYPAIAAAVRAGQALSPSVQAPEVALGRNSLAARVGPPDADASLLRREAASELAASLGATAAAAALGQSAAGSVRAGPTAFLQKSRGVGRPRMATTQAGAWLSRPSATVTVRGGEAGEAPVQVGALTLARGTGRDEAPQAWLATAAAGPGLTDAQISAATQKTLRRTTFALVEPGRRSAGSGASAASLRANALLMRPVDAPSDLTTFDTAPARGARNTIPRKFAKAI